MAQKSGSEKKTYVSTFRIDLKPPGPLQTQANGEKRVEHGTTVTIKAQRSCVGGTPTAESIRVIHNKKALNQPADRELDGETSKPLYDPPNKSLDGEKTRKVVTPKRRACSGTEPAVEFLDAPEQVEVRIGERARLHCAFSSCLPVASCWIHNREQVMVDKERTRVECSDQGSSLVITNTLPKDAGSYIICIRNRRGSAQHTITLSVIDCPDPPASCPFVSQLTCSSLVLSWSGPSYDGGKAISGYVVELRRVGPSEPGDWSELTSQCKNTSYRVRSGLDALGEYCFRVRAYNAVGVSDPSKESDCIKMDTAGEPQEESQTYMDIVINTTNTVREHYNLHEMLGVGKFGQVFRLTHKETGRLCAGKFYRGRRSKEKAAARKEIELMKELHHPKLVQCLGAYDSRAEIVMILEYIAGGELFERIVDDNFEHTEPTSVRYMRQLLEGIQYIHQKSIIHLDLKPENILCVNTTGTLIKIIDFGLASKLEPGTPLMVMHGTPEFVAPEVIGYEPVGLATDMWSIGVICYILLSGESPFQGNSDAETLAQVTAAHWEFDPESFDDITDEAKDFITSLLKKDKRARLSCEEALAHPWMAAFTASDSRITKPLNKGRMKRFLAKRKWKVEHIKYLERLVCPEERVGKHWTRAPIKSVADSSEKTGKAVLALQRMANLSSRADKSDSPSSPMDELSLGPEAEQAVQSLEQSLRSEPRFPRALRDVTESRGATVRLTCTIHGYPDPEVVWLQDEEPMEETERVQLEYEEDGLCTLVLSHLEPEDSGIYKCRAFNSLGEALCSARLTVENTQI